MHYTQGQPQQHNSPKNRDLALRACPHIERLNGGSSEMLLGYLEEVRGGKRAEREIGRYVNETYRS